MEGALAIMKITDAAEKSRYFLHYIGETTYNALCDTFGNANVLAQRNMTNQQRS